MKKDIIWSYHTAFDLEDDKEFREEICDGCSRCEKSECARQEDCLWETAWETNAEYLNAERMNLDEELEGEIVVIASLGRWNGRVEGIKRLRSNNLNSFLRSLVDCESYCEFYADAWNVRGTEENHDGTNYYLYRVMRKDRDIETLFEKYRNGEKVSNNLLNYYTRSIRPDVAKVYGW